MQYGLPDSAKNLTPRPENDDVAPIESGHAFGMVAEMVGERKRVLDLGCGDGRLARLLSQRECDVVGVDINPTAIEEARRYCTHAIVADLDATSLSELVGDREFDVVVLGSVLQRLRQPTRLLDSARSLLRDGGLVVAVAPNVAHGAIRLSLLQGQFDGKDGLGQRLFTAKTIDELFLAAGYRIDTIARTKAPIFDGSDLVPQLQRDDFDPAVVAEVQRDPEAETLQFVVRAVSLSNDAKERAISKRFLTANTELAATRVRLAKRERELERLTQLLDERQNDGKVEALTAQIGTLRTERDTARDQMEQHRAHAAALRNERDQVSGEIIGLRAAIAQREKDLAEATNLAEQHKAHAAALRTERDREMGDSAALRAALSELQSNEANLRAHLEQITAEHAAALGKAALEVTNLRLAAGEHDTSLKLLRADRDTSVAEYKAIRAERDAALRDFREAGELLEIADREIAALSQETQTYAGLLALADSDARAAAAKLGSAGMLANQLYDEIRALYELRAIANAEVAEARTALKRDTASLAAEVERLDEETRTLRLKLVNRARAHDRLESETRDILAELERERDAEREARIAGDELHDSLRVAVTVAREELRMANATIERLSDNTATAEEIETANLLIARLEEEREAQYAARIVSEEQHANLSAALIDARHQANDLKDRLTALERRMVEQTQMMLDQTRADSERTAVLIETVQTSIFWKIKRAVGRMTGRG